MRLYEEYLEQLRERHRITVKEATARLCEILKQEDPNLSKDDIYDRIMKDCLEFWQRSTIIKNMPDELKDRERQETGHKGAEKRLLKITTAGDLASNLEANSDDFKPESPTEPNSSTFEKQPDWETEKQRVYESNHNDNNKGEPRIDWQRSFHEALSTIDKKKGIIKDQKVRIDKLEEMLTEQKKILDETIKSVNAAASLKKKDNVVVTDSLEYKALESQLYVIQQENKELKQIAQMQMKQNPTETFKPASEINATVLEIEFPAKEIGAFFLDCRNAKQVMFLKIADGKVVSWESDAKRGNKRS